MLRLVNPPVKNSAVLAFKCVAKAQRETTQTNDVRTVDHQSIKKCLLFFSDFVGCASRQNRRMLRRDTLRSNRLREGSARGAPFSYQSGNHCPATLITSCTNFLKQPSRVMAAFAPALLEVITEVGDFLAATTRRFSFGELTSSQPATNGLALYAQPFTDRATETTGRRYMALLAALFRARPLTERRIRLFEISGSGDGIRT